MDTTPTGTSSTRIGPVVTTGPKHRWMIALVVLVWLGVCWLVSPGCQPTVPSPKNPSIRVAADVAMAEAESIAKAHEREKVAATRRFRLAAQKLEAETGIELAELTAAYDETVEKAEAEAASIRQATAAAIKAAEERQSAWVGGLGTVATIAQSSGIPGLATIGGLLAGGLGLFSAAANKRKAKTAEEIAAAEAAQRKATEEAAGRVVDSIDLLKLVSPEVAAAIKAHSKTLADWQGPDAVKFVSRIQNS